MLASVLDAGEWSYIAGVAQSVSSALDADEWSYIRSVNVHARKTRRQAVLRDCMYWVILTGIDCNSVRQM